MNQSQMSGSQTVKALGTPQTQKGLKPDMDIKNDSQPADDVTATNTTSEATAAADPFDPERLRLSADFGDSLGVKKVITTIPCRKPNRHEWIRVRPGDNWRLETVLFEDKLANESYLVEPELVPELLGEITPVCLFIAVNRQNDPFLWAAKLPGPEGRSSAWHTSALEAATLAQSRWVRIAANMGAGYYDVFETTADLPEPNWPEKELRELLEICFRDQFIRDQDHFALKRLRGEL